MAILHDVFGGTGQITWWQETARALLIFLYGLALVRIAGRRVFGKWSALDIIVSVIVGSNLSRALTGNAALWQTIVATTAIMALHWFLAHLAARSQWFSGVVEGAAVHLAMGGKANRPVFLSHAISENDLTEALRGSGVEDLDQTRLVTLEPSGKINVLKSK